MPENVTLQVNGESVSVPAGSMVSTAIAIAQASFSSTKPHEENTKKAENVSGSLRDSSRGVVEGTALAFRRSVTGEARAPLCGMGICFECRVTINGQPHSRSCQIPAANGQNVVTEWERMKDECGMMTFHPSSFILHPSSVETEVLVIGAGPAGIAAAIRAAEGGKQVCVVDDNPAPASPGGQIWRGDQARPSSAEAKEWFERLKRVNVSFIHGARIFAQPEAGCLLAETTDGSYELRFEKLVLATGARERFLPFPGWTLPGVMGAGGLQALAKSGFPVAGKRVVVAGSGPLLMAVAAYLRKHGAEIVLIAEQASWSRLIRFGSALFGQPSKISQAINFKKQLAGVHYLPGCWPITAKGKYKLEAVTLRRGDKTWDVDCDYLACGFYLLPNTELAGLLGCEVKNGAVSVNEFQQTSLSNVYCAGETTGIGGLELSLVEGQIAGLAAASYENVARRLFAERAKQQRFAEVLNRTFALREELRALPTADTLVCRCEDVSFERLQKQGSWREAKLQMRCGMGPCQGRICGAATEFLFGWGMESVRPPVFPVRLENLTYP
ncbi:MAG: FAD-dependent oxidoreductase [Acidobacteria bacterium]|nr:FAD-dependent oxidoreductase [Acidobacteriota bacterium]